MTESPASGLLRAARSEPLREREPVGAGLDGDVLEHRVAAGRGERGVALAVTGVDAPAAPRHHALAFQITADLDALARKLRTIEQKRAEIAELIEAAIGSSFTSAPRSTP